MLHASKFLIQGLKTFNQLHVYNENNSNNINNDNSKKCKKRKKPPGTRTTSASTTNSKGKIKAKHPLQQQQSQEDNEDVYLLDFVQCILEPIESFNLPRISAFLERLMGTNVVRLTDRKYMSELRQRIEADYRKQLQQRIQARELKEVERERILIIEGKTDIIPEELSEDPIFVVNKAAAKEINKTRAKLKTNRERNSERLKLQGVKWERERLQHEEEERQRLEVLKERRKEQKELEERYKSEDAECGMDLLRIDNEDWRDCEQKLKEFLELERAKMKARSNKVPRPFTSDPLDVQNIVRARQRFREAEHRIRQELEEKFKGDKTITPIKEFKAKSAAARVSKILAADVVSLEDNDIFDSRVVSVEYQFEDRQFLTRKSSYDASDVISEVDLTEQASTISASKRRHAAELEEELESDVQRGLLISKEQFNHLRYEEEKIMQLRHATNIRELYRLAEEIIIGERIEEEIVDDEAMEEQEEEEEVIPIGEVEEPDD